MKLTSGLVMLLVGISMYSCRQANKNCKLKYVDINKQTYQIEGCLNQASLEDGDWKVYDTNHVVIETGNYLNGIRVGEWKYPKESNLSLNWVNYSDEKIGLSTNILSGFSVVEGDSGYVKLSNRDSNNLTNLVIAVHDISSSRIDPEEYHKQGESELIQKGLTFQQIRTDLILKERKAYFNEYKISGSNGYSDKEFYISNIYSPVSDNKMLEISCRYTEKGGLVARKMFFGVMTNIFIHEERFINPFDLLINVIERKN